MVTTRASKDARPTEPGLQVNWLLIFPGGGAPPLWCSPAFFLVFDAFIVSVSTYRSGASGLCDYMYEKLDTVSSFPYQSANNALGRETSMTFKEMNAAVMLLSALVISAWVLRDALADPTATVQVVAARLCWAMLASIVFNIVAIIVFTILISIAQGRELKDEAADERDHSVGSRAMRNAYIVASAAGAGGIFIWAFGIDFTVGIYVLFGGLMLAGATDAVSRLVYYRIG